MSTTLVTIDRTEADGFETIVVRGELDLTNASLLADALATAAQPFVILDLGGLAFVDSAGIRTIDQAHRLHRDGGGRLVLVAPESSRAAWTFKVAGFADDYLVSSIAEAEALVRP
jgi:anti-anti-sigma factor